MKKSLREMKIAAKEMMSADICRMVLAPLQQETAEQVIPGQFVGIYPPQNDKMLPRPISICDYDAETGRITLVFRTAGEGTSEIAACSVCDRIKVLGILGNGYDLRMLYGKRVALMGGGIGIPPMLYLAKALQETAETTCFLGYRDSSTFLEEAFREQVRTVTASEDGSKGIKGNVLDALHADIASGTGVLPEVICACGPKPMLKAIQQFAADNGIQCFLSLEERMACGVGACLGCVAKTVDRDPHFGANYARVCTDGPVFEGSRVVL